MTTTAHDVRHDVPWIPVTYHDGRSAVLPLQPALEQAHLIREVHGEPHIWTALMRFLPGVVALICRQDEHADFDEWARTGIPATAITAGLNKVGDRWHLRHPDTPFLQDARLVPDAKTANSVEWLLLNPSPTSKSWWGKPGDTHHPDSGTPARIAQGLVVSWFLSPGVPGRAVGRYADAPDSGWRPRGTLGYHNHGLRVFWRGENLAHTLLANTMENHARTGRRNGKNLPLWAVDGDTRPGAGALTSSTWTGSVYLLAWDEDGACTGVNSGGRRIDGLPLDAGDAKDAVKAAETSIWRTDPTIPRVPIVKAGEETGEVRPVRPLHPSASAVQWAAEWFVTDDRRNAARPMEPGLVETGEVDATTIRIEGARQAPEIAHIARVGEVSAIAAPRARSRLITLAGTVLTPLRKVFYGAAARAISPDAAGALTEKLYAQFAIEAEPLLDDLVHTGTLDTDPAPAFTGAAITAFEKVMAPYASSAPGISAATAYLTSRLHGTPRRHPYTNQTAALVHWAVAVRSSGRTTAVRAVLARAVTPAGCQAALAVPAVAKRLAHIPEHHRPAAVSALGVIARSSLTHTHTIPLGASLAGLESTGTIDALTAIIPGPADTACRIIGSALTRAGKTGPVNLCEFVDLISSWDDTTIRDRSAFLVDLHAIARA